MNFIGISNSPAHVAGPPNNYPVVSPAAAEDYEDDGSFMPDGSVVGTFNSVTTERPVEVDEYIGELHDEAHDFIVDIRDASGASKARKATSAHTLLSHDNLFYTVHVRSIVDCRHHEFVRRPTVFDAPFLQYPFFS